MRIEQVVRTGLGHGGITCVLQTQFSSFLIVLQIFVSPAKQKRDICIAFPASSLSSSFPNSYANFCLAWEAEARHMYCFSGVVIVVVGGGVNFFVFRSFSQKL